MRRRTNNSPSSNISLSGGYSLVELLLVLLVLGICLAFGAAALAGGLRTQEARGAAQSWQAAAAWAQVGVLWHGGATCLAYDSGAISLTHEYELCGGNLGSSAPAVHVTTNVARWAQGAKTAVGFSGYLASPDGGGSLYFQSGGSVYRVAVRPESGLTSRSRLESVP
jgi:prepilin-type N-terminal cleavage/methylation domain-containing protein